MKAFGVLLRAERHLVKIVAGDEVYYGEKRNFVDEGKEICKTTHHKCLK